MSDWTESALGSRRPRPTTQPSCRWLGVRCCSWMSRIHLVVCRTRSTADTSGIGMGSTLGTSPTTVSSSALTATTWASFAMKTASASNTAMRASEGAPGRLAQTVPARREAIGRPEQSPVDGLTSAFGADQRLSAPRDRPGRTVAVEQRCQRPLVSPNLGCERGACLACLRTARPTLPLAERVNQTR